MYAIYAIVLLGSKLLAFLLQHLQLLFLSSLFPGLLHKVPQGLAFHDFMVAEDLIKIFLQLLPSSLDIFWILVGDSEEFFLWELRPA